MSHPQTARNPFLLMISPEVVLAAVEKSERLGQLNRQLCRPLDRPQPAKLARAAVAAEDGDEDEGRSDRAWTWQARRGAGAPRFACL
mgnify:CR=1 FL=1